MMMKDLLLVAPRPAISHPRNRKKNPSKYNRLERNVVATEHNYQKQGVFRRRSVSPAPEVVLSEGCSPSSPDVSSCQEDSSNGSDSDDSISAAAYEDTSANPWYHHLDLDLNMDHDVGLGNLNEIPLSSGDEFLMGGDVNVCSPTSSITSSGCSSAGNTSEDSATNGGLLNEADNHIEFDGITNCSSSPSMDIISALPYSDDDSKDIFSIIGLDIDPVTTISTSSVASTSIASPTQKTDVDVENVSASPSLPSSTSSRSSLAPVPNRARVGGTQTFILHTASLPSSTNYQCKSIGNRIVMNTANHPRSYVLRGSYSSAAGSGNILTKEEKRLLSMEGRSIPEGVALSKGEERLLKKIRRKIRNKESAMQSRRRKKQYVEDLETRVHLCNAERDEYKTRLESIRKENALLRAEVTRLKKQQDSSSSNNNNMSKHTRLAAFLLIFTCTLLPHLSPLISHISSLPSNPPSQLPQADPPHPDTKPDSPTIPDHVLNDVMQQFQKQNYQHEHKQQFYADDTFPFAGNSRTLLSFNQYTHQQDPSIQPQVPYAAAITPGPLYQVAAAKLHNTARPAEVADSIITAEEAAWFGETLDTFHHKMVKIGDVDGGDRGRKPWEDVYLDWTSGNDPLPTYSSSQLQNDTAHIPGMPGDEVPIPSVLIVSGNVLESHAESDGQGKRQEL